MKARIDIRLEQLRKKLEPRQVELKPGLILDKITGRMSYTPQPTNATHVLERPDSAPVYYKPGAEWSTNYHCWVKILPEFNLQYFDNHSQCRRLHGT